LSKPLSEYDSIKRMVIDIMSDHPSGASYSYLKSQITLIKLLPSHLETMIDEGVLYRASYKGGFSSKFRLARKVHSK
jgi:hypothetical protein